MAGWGTLILHANNALCVPFLPPLVAGHFSMHLCHRHHHHRHHLYPHHHHHLHHHQHHHHHHHIHDKILAATKLTCFSDPMGDRTKGCDKTKGFKTCFVRYDQGDCVIIKKIFLQLLLMLMFSSQHKYFRKQSDRTWLLNEASKVKFQFSNLLIKDHFFVHFTLTHLIKGTQLVKLIATAPQVKGNYLAKIVINN